MPSPLFDDVSVPRRATSLLLLLAAANLAAWGWAWMTFRHHPALLGTALLAWGFGLRHAVDADHIAAIDNVTRKLMRDGVRPVSVGFWFSLGHSTVVVAATVAIAGTASSFRDWLGSVGAVGGVIGTSVSAGFLCLIAAANLVTLRRIRRALRAAPPAPEAPGFGGGLLARLFRPLFRLMSRSWHMYPLGFLFGLGFDTATEIGLLGVSAAAASSGLPIWSILVFPALFTAGMSLIDTADGLLMLGAYGWAHVDPARKLRYDQAITTASVALAFGIGGIEVLGLLRDRLALDGGIWRLAGALQDQLGLLGGLAVAFFALWWLGAVALLRRRRAETA